ncbi:MAG: hypothetical protein SGJ21_03070 [Alphaproteobacteria bacterium]|nr:hypothetical protein [Alphaproteobacteria bacterium]
MGIRQLAASAGLMAFAGMTSGCAIVGDLGATGVAENIEDNAAVLNDAHTRAMTAIIAKNVLRARDRWPTNYTTLSGIKSNPTLSLNGSANLGPLGLGNAPLPFAGSSASVSRNETANAEYSVNPFANNDKSQSLLKPIQPDMLQSYWRAGWPRETLMWLFVDAVIFPGEPIPWFIDGDEFSESPTASDRANVQRYAEVIARAKNNELDFDQLPAADLDARNCTTYDPVYLRETLGVREEPLSATVATIEELTGKSLILSPDTRTPRTEALVAPDKFNRRLMLCDSSDSGWGFVDARTGETVLEIRTRSFDDMIYFLGETLRSGGREKPVTVGGVVLFQTYGERDGREFAVRVEHAGEVHFIAPQNVAGVDYAGARDVTGNVLSLLNQLFLLAQSDEFLRAPEAKLR